MVIAWSDDEDEQDDSDNNDTEDGEVMQMEMMIRVTHSWRRCLFHDGFRQRMAEENCTIKWSQRRAYSLQDNY